MEDDDRRPSIQNIAEVPWEEFPGHHGGAVSKPPRTRAPRQPADDHRKSCYRSMAYVEPHTHKVQEQAHHVLDGEGLIEIGERSQVVRRHDLIFVLPGVRHAIRNTGLTDLVFLVVTSLVTDEWPLGHPPCRARRGTQGAFGRGRIAVVARSGEGAIPRRERRPLQAARHRRIRAQSRLVGPRDPVQGATGVRGYKLAAVRRDSR
ncbi:MAG: cupin domain-containing protein [Acetobacteraceae bacterium]|nr:cupin domain-containing protein [Acetobacteraceae bacterium]